MNNSVVCLLLLCFSSVLCDPVYWLYTIADDAPGNPIPREFQTLTNIPGTTYNVLFGGIAYNSTVFSLGDTWILDTESDVWKQASLTTSPPARGYAIAGATSSQDIILFGGSTETVPKVFYNDVWRYSFSKNTWSKDVFTVPSVVLSRSYHAGVVVGDILYVFGGFVSSAQAVANDLWSYNTVSKAWSLHSANGRAGAPLARQGHSAVFFNDTVVGPSIIFFGGYNGTGGLNDVWQYQISTTNWIQLSKGSADGPSPRWGSSVVGSSNTSIVIFGGSFVGGTINPYYNDVWSLTQADPASHTWKWTQLLPDGEPEGPWKRAGHSSVLSGGRSFTFGGYGQFVGLYNGLWELLNY